MTPLETVPWERLVWDTNRLRKGAQRQFHASAQERAGASTTVTERAARELAPFMTPHHLEEALERAYDAHRSPDTVAEDLARAGVRNPQVHLRMNIWWAEEWLRPDSPYNVRILSDDERARANELLWNLCRSDVFPGLTLETIDQHPDAVIICETAALRRRYVVTENMLRQAVGIGQWTRELQDAGLIDQREIILPADDSLRQWAVDHPGWACETVATAFWPERDNASAHEVEARVQELLPVLGDANLVQVAAAAERELHRTNDWPGWVERMRNTLPHKTRRADRRHPANPANRDRDWSAPAPDLERTRTHRRWKIRVERERTVVTELQHDETYRRVRSFPRGAERALARYFIEHDIEIAGLPRHGGHSGTRGDGGFSSALAAAIEEERVRSRP